MIDPDKLEELDVSTQADDPFKLIYPILARLSFYRTTLGDPRTGAGLEAPVGAKVTDRATGKTYEKLAGDANAWKETGARFAHTFYADSKAANGGDGSPDTPFNSLQAAINAAQQLPSDQRKIIIVAADSAFDEDVTVTGGLMMIMGLGPWTLGDAAGTAFNSTTARNFTYNSGGTLPDGKWPSLVLGTLTDGETSSTHTAYMNGATISGDFIFNETHSISHNLQLRNVKVQGNFTQTGVGGIQTYLRRCFFDNLFTGSSILLNIAESCEFDGLLTVQSHGRIWQCEISGGMTTQSLNNSLPPNGMMQTNFSGTFTGPAASLLLDAVTNYFFNANGAVLAGGATRVLMHDETIV